MTRRSASPDVDARSHCPPPPFFNRATNSADVFGLVWWTVQWVCCSNGFTHRGCAYPAHAIRLRAPSPCPIDVCGFMFAVGGCPAPAGPPPPPPPPPLLQAAATSVSATAITPSRSPFLALISPPPDRRGAGPPRPLPIAPASKPA